MSPQRTALAAAIQAHNAAAGARAAAMRAQGPALEAVHAAQRHVYGAEAALADARAAAARHASDVLTAARPGPRTAPSLREARGALVAAQDGLEAAEQAQALVKAHASDTRHETTLLRLQEAAAAVIASEAGAVTEALAREVAELQTKLLDRGRALAWLGPRVLPLEKTPGRTYGQILDEAVRRVLWRLDAPPASWDDEPFKGFPVVTGAAPWQAWAEALMRDANALMPKGP